MIRLDHKYRRAPYLEILTEEQVYSIHSASLEILERIGVKCHNEKALKLLKEGGAYVDGDRVKIPPPMVEEAIGTAPSRSLITGRRGNGKVLLERNVSNYGCGTDVPYHLDPYTHEIRLTVLKDIENMNKIVQKCGNIDFTSNSGLASDVEPELQDLYHYKMATNYCDKPFFTTAANGENMKALINMATVFAGSHEKLAQAPSLIVYGEPVSPLSLEQNATDVLLVCSEYKIPIVFPPMVQLGATGPMTLAGGIAQGSAETLASLVVHQLKNPGAPFIWGPFVSMMDMHTTVCCYGGPVLMKSQIALGQISRFYGIPTFGFACVTDSADIDAQFGTEVMWSALTNALAGLNLCHDVGYMNSGLIVSLESLLFADEIISAVSHFMNGIEVNEETLALDVIEKVGPLGNFLTEKHTVRFLEQETWHSKIMSRKHFRSIITKGGKTIKQKLEEKAHQIIEEEVSPLLSDDEVKELDKIIAAREKELT
ncbi:MAG: trimethylamine methyltransferase family protein [Dehalococcoidia bacterium]|nr:MAG: trimethylamine methyltransferase family protein [Dehalococcoidia bacterium]